MGDLGNLLRRTREAKGLTLAQVEESTRIRIKYIEALEAEEYDQLPHGIYVKGFLKTYASFLGLDADEALALLPQPEPPSDALPPPATTPAILDEPLYPFVIHRTWVIGVIVVVALGIALWQGYQRSRSNLPPVATPAPTSPVDEPTAAVTSIATMTVAPSPTATLTPTPAMTGVTVTLEITNQPAWVRVEVDEEEGFTGTLRPGTSRTFEGRQRIVIRCGNAGAARVTVNGQDVGQLGVMGQVVTREWTAAGVPTRTPSVTPTRATTVAPPTPTP